MEEYKTKIGFIRAYLGGVCVHCGTNENLHIDHIDHENKSFTIANNWGFRGISWNQN